MKKENGHELLELSTVSGSRKLRDQQQHIAAGAGPLLNAQSQSH